MRPGFNYYCYVYFKQSPYGYIALQLFELSPLIGTSWLYTINDKVI